MKGARKARRAIIEERIAALSPNDLAALKNYRTQMERDAELDGKEIHVTSSDEEFYKALATLILRDASDPTKSITELINDIYRKEGYIAKQNTDGTVEA